MIGGSHLEMDQGLELDKGGLCICCSERRRFAVCLKARAGCILCERHATAEVDDAGVKRPGSSHQLWCRVEMSV